VRTIVGQKNGTVSHHPQDTWAASDALLGEWNRFVPEYNAAVLGSMKRASIRDETRAAPLAQRLVTGLPRLPFTVAILRLTARPNYETHWAVG